MKFTKFLFLVVTVSAYSASVEQEPMCIMLKNDAKNQSMEYKSDDGETRTVRYIHSPQKGEFVVRTLGRGCRFSVEMDFVDNVRQEMTARVKCCWQEALVTVGVPSQTRCFEEGIPTGCLGNVRIASAQNVPQDEPQKAPIDWFPDVSHFWERPSTYGIINADKNAANIVWYIYRAPRDAEVVFVGVHVDYENPKKASFYWGTGADGSQAIVAWRGPVKHCDEGERKNVFVDSFASQPAFWVAPDDA